MISEVLLLKILNGKTIIAAIVKLHRLDLLSKKALKFTL